MEIVVIFQCTMHSEDDALKLSVIIVNILEDQKQENQG